MEKIGFDTRAILNASTLTNQEMRLRERYIEKKIERKYFQIYFCDKFIFYLGFYDEILMSNVIDLSNIDFSIGFFL